MVPRNDKAGIPATHRPQKLRCNTRLLRRIAKTPAPVYAFHYRRIRKEGESIMIERIPESGTTDESLLAAVEKAKEIIAGVRTIRLQKNIPNKEPLTLQAIGLHDNGCDAIIVKLGNLSSIETASSKEATAASFLVGTTEYAVPLGNSIDVEAEIKKLEDELKYQQGFLRSVLGKLGNERFVNNAPVQVVEMERKKQADAEVKIAAIEAQLKGL